MSRKNSHSSSSLSKRGSASIKTGSSQTVSEEISSRADSLYIKERDQMMKYLWDDIYDLAFREIYEPYLAEQTMRFNIHCALEACAKVVAFTNIVKDEGEPIADERIWGEDKLPNTSPIDVMFENGAPWPPDKLDMIYANDECILMDGKMEVTEDGAFPLVDPKKFDKKHLYNISFMDKK